MIGHPRLVLLGPKTQLRKAFKESSVHPDRQDARLLQQSAFDCKLNSVVIMIHEYRLFIWPFCLKDVCVFGPPIAGKIKCTHLTSQEANCSFIHCYRFIFFSSKIWIRLWWWTTKGAEYTNEQGHHTLQTCTSAAAGAKLSAPSSPFLALSITTLIARIENYSILPPFQGGANTLRLVSAVLRTVLSTRNPEKYWGLTIQLQQGRRSRFQDPKKMFTKKHVLAEPFLAEKRTVFTTYHFKNLQIELFKMAEQPSGSILSVHPCFGCQSAANLRVFWPEKWQDTLSSTMMLSLMGDKKFTWKPLFCKQWAASAANIRQILFNLF